MDEKTPATPSTPSTLESKEGVMGLAEVDPSPVDENSL